MSVVKGFLFRAKNLSSDRRPFLTELDRAKKILVNNGYSNQMIDLEIRKFLRKDSTNVQNTRNSQSRPETTDYKSVIPNVFKSSVYEILMETTILIT